MRPREWGLLLFLSVLFGSSFFFYGVAVKGFPTFTIVFLRVLIGALLLMMVMRYVGESWPKSRQVWFWLLAMALLNNVIPFSLIAWGQTHVASGVASILNAATPLFGVIVAHYFTSDESMSIRRIAGVIVGLVGVIVMIGYSSLTNLGVEMYGPLAIVLGAFSYSLASVFGRRFAKAGVAPVTTATGQVLASSVILLPVVLIVDQPWSITAPGMDAIGAVLGLAIFSTALAFIVYFKLLSSAGATNVLLVTFLLPVTAILLGVFVLDEVLLVNHFQGMVLIGLGLIAIDGRVLSFIQSRLIRTRKILPPKLSG